LRNGGRILVDQLELNGVELAYIAKERNPKLDVVVTSGRPLSQALPDGAKFWAKPWAPLDVLREAELAQAPS